MSSKYIKWQQTVARISWTNPCLSLNLLVHQAVRDYLMVYQMPYDTKKNVGTRTC
jgi:hypothetical protein